MPLQAQQRVVTIHSGAIIYHPNERYPATGDSYFNPACTGIDTVLDQLLDDRGGPLDYFAGSDLARHFIRQQKNATHALILSQQREMRIANCGMRNGRTRKGNADRELRIAQWEKTPNFAFLTATNPQSAV
jgi:hypothetical protein